MLRRHIVSKGKHITNKGNVNPSDRAELGRHIAIKSDVNSGDGSKIGRPNKVHKERCKNKKAHTPSDSAKLGRYITNKGHLETVRMRGKEKQQ